MPAAGFLMCRMPGLFSLCPGFPRLGGREAVPEFFPCGFAVVFVIYGSRRVQTISPYFPFLTSPAILPSTRVITRLRMMLTYWLA